MAGIGTGTSAEIIILANEIVTGEGGLEEGAVATASSKRAVVPTSSSFRGLTLFTATEVVFSETMDEDGRGFKEDTPDSSFAVIGINSEEDEVFFVNLEPGSLDIGNGNFGDQRT